jgi:SHS2 domain-containing protein
MKQYEFKDHTADIIARAYGNTLEDAFASAAKAMFDVITRGSEIKAIEQYELTVESIDTEGLLVGFLSELIVLHETENVVLGQFRVEILSPTRLRAVCQGEPFDPKKHGDGTPVKGISYHMMEIEENDDAQFCQVQVLFDI